MDSWTIEEPTELALGAVESVKIRLVAGHVDVVGTDGEARLEVTELVGPPLIVTLEDGRLVVTYDDLSWQGLFSWGRLHRRRTAVLSLAVPHSCPVQLGVVSASAIVSGMSGETSVRSVSGDVTLDGVSAAVSANTVSGNVETEALDGPLHFKTVSGHLTIAHGSTGQLRAKTVSGDVTADVDLSPGGRIGIESVSGDVRLRLAESVGAKVDLASISGHLDSAFEGLDSGERPGRRSRRGAIGDGSGSIHARTVSGSVALLRRPGPGTEDDTRSAE
jgi:hypothetical protein